jgi:hypothetical protein
MDNLYNDLNSVCKKTSSESVHLTDFPIKNSTIINVELEKKAKKSFTCCQMKQQVCCLVSAGSLPCNDEYAPMACTLLQCCMVYPGFACCKKLSESMPEKYGGGSGVDVTVNVAGAAPMIEMIR